MPRANVLLSNVPIPRRRDVDLMVLPDDFCKVVFEKATGEIQRVYSRWEWLCTELEKLDGQLRDARARVIDATPKILFMPESFFDALAGKMVVKPGVDRGAGIKTAAVIKLQGQLLKPLEKRKAALKVEIAVQETEIAELRKIAKMAGTGAAGLITFLANKWASRLEIGGHIIGKLPPVARAGLSNHVLYVDALGYPLPPEALNPETKEPDLPRSINLKENSGFSLPG